MKNTKTHHKKLDARGVGHVILPMLILLLVAIAGCFVLVLKHNNQAQAPAALAPLAQPQGDDISSFEQLNQAPLPTGD